MPNHVTNMIHMKGISTLPLFTANEEGDLAFDFKRLIPMPESLDMEAGSMEEDAIFYFLTERFAIPFEWLDEEKKNILRCTADNNNAYCRMRMIHIQERIYPYRAVKKQQLYAAGQQYVQNIKDHGYATWYGWCSKHWGTKWNAYDTCILDADTISFDTAWNPPTPIIEALAKQYPTIEITHDWADEDEGCNTGHCVYLNGQMTGGPDEDNSAEARERYQYCKG